MAVLVGCLGKAVQEDDDAFLGKGRGGWAVDVGEAEGGGGWEGDG